MTPQALIESQTAVHGPVVARTIRLDRTRVYIAAELTDGTRVSGPVGLIAEPGVFEAAKEWAGVMASVLTAKGDRLVLGLLYDDGRYERDELMAWVDSPNADLSVPPDLSDQFEGIVAEHAARTRRHDAGMDTIQAAFYAEDFPAWLPSNDRRGVA